MNVQYLILAIEALCFVQEGTQVAPVFKTGVEEDDFIWGGGHRGNCGQTTWLQGHSEGESAGGGCAPSCVKCGSRKLFVPNTQ